MAFRERNQIYADLRWAIESPPLLHGGDDRWCDWPTSSFYTTLWQQHATPLISEQDSDQIPPMRLGHYFESLWHLWLRDHPRYQLLLANTAWRENGITLGETDLLIRDRHSELVEHWELAVKFYLGVGDVSSPAQWHGPQFRDRLDHKLAHLRFQQTRLTQLESVKQQLAQQNIVVTNVRCIVKGRLFFPWALYWQKQQAAFASPECLRGFWLTQGEWRDVHHRFLYCRRISREQFLAPLSAGAIEVDLAHVSLAENERPLALAICDQNGVEQHRGFIVPDNWASLAQQHCEKLTME